MPQLYQSVDLSVDLLAESICARTVLVISQASAESDVVRLHCRRISVLKVVVNEIDAGFTYADAMSNIFPGADGPVGGCCRGSDMDALLRGAVEVSRRGELSITIPAVYCCRASQLAEEDSITSESDSDSEASLDEQGQHVDSQSSPVIISEALPRVLHSTPAAEQIYPNSEMSCSDEKPQRNEVSKNEVSGDEEASDSPQPVDPSLYRSVTFLPALPKVSDMSKSVLARWAAVEAEIDRFINAGGRVLKIEIQYRVESPSCGLVFRRSGEPPTSHTGLAAALLSGCIGIHPAYGAGGGQGPVGGLYNPDGVRCWLPCMDDPHERSTFDCTVRLSMAGMSRACQRYRLPTRDEPDAISSQQLSCNYLKWLCKLSVVCSGIFIPPCETAVTMGAVAAASSPDGHLSYRYITAEPISASSLGVFIGAMQTYRSPIYGSTGFVCMPAQHTILEDTLLSQDAEPDENLVETWAAHSHQLLQPLKDARQLRQGFSGYRMASVSLPPHMQDAFMGLEQATRYLQRSLGKRFPHRQFCVILLPDVMGCSSTCGDGCFSSPFLAFDGMAIVQMSGLCCSSNTPFLESSSHLTLVNAFLTSWLSSGIPIRSYDDEFIVTGAVGYLLGDYVSYIYGNADGKVYMLKLYDTIVTLECQSASQGVPLANSLSDVPVGYELFSISSAALFRARSVMLMYLIEHRLNHNGEAMKGRVLKCIMSACPDFNNSHASIRLHKNLLQANTPTGSAGALFPPASPQASPQHNPYVGPPSTSRVVPPGIFPPESPQPNASPHPGHRFDMAPPSLWRNYSTQSATSQSIFPPESPQPSASPHPGHRFDMAPPMLVRAPSTQQGHIDGAQERREDGVTPAKSAPNDNSAPQYNFMEPTALLEICRSAAGGAVADLEHDFIDRNLYSSGVVLMRIGAVLDKKSKKLECVVQQVAFSNGRVETQLTAELKGEKKKKRVLTSSMPYLFTKLDFHVISGGEVWKYSRALESYTQSIGVTIYTKPKKVGRKRLIDTLTATAASEATNYNDISNLDDLEEAHIDKALTSLQQVRASMFNESIHVSFLSIDPDILCVRCTNTASLPVSFAVEQLFTDADEWGQLQALRALGSATPLTESVADTMLRLTALSDCLKETCFMDKAIDSIKHHVFIRANAAYCLAKYQNEHAPRLSTTVSAGSWIAMKAIITAYLQYYYIFPANYLTARQPANSSIGGKIPGPFSLDDIADTHLRCALLLALSSVHARSGATPFEAIQLLLNQAENVHASTISAALAEGAQQNDGGPSSYDDSHVCSVVLLALSRIRVSTYLTSLSRNKHPTAAHGSGKPPSDLCYAVLHRIRVVAAFYLERDLVFSVSVTEQDEEVPARREKRVVTAAGGILTASALQCLCEVDCQLHPVTMARPSAALLNSDSSKTDVYESSSTGPINYFAYLDSSKYSPLVRSAAIECILKLMVYSIADQKSLMSVPEKCERRTRAGSEVALAGSEDNVFYAPQPADLLSVVMFVVSSDPDVCVRRNAAQAFLSVTQGVSPLRMIESAISLGSVMDTFDWSDPSGFTAINGFKAMKFDAFDVVKCIGDDTSSGMSAAILQLKSLIGCHRLVASDQTTRCLLFRAWLVLFGAESPKALQSHELIAKNNILGNFQFLNPPRLVVPHPIQSMNDVNDLLVWGDQLRCLPEKAFSTAVPFSASLARSLQTGSNQAQQPRPAEDKPLAPASSGKGAGMLRISSSASVLSIKRPREPEPGLAPPASGPGIIEGNIQKKPRFRLSSSASTATLG